MFRHVFKLGFYYKFKVDCLQWIHWIPNKSICRRSVKCIVTASTKMSTSEELSSGLKKGFLLYHHLDFNVVIARVFAVLGVSKKLRLTDILFSRAAISISRKKVIIASDNPELQRTHSLCHMLL